MSLKYLIHQGITTKSLILNVTIIRAKAIIGMCEVSGKVTHFGAYHVFAGLARSVASFDLFVLLESLRVHCRSAGF